MLLYAFVERQLKAVSGYYHLCICPVFHSICDKVEDIKKAVLILNHSLRWKVVLISHYFIFAVHITAETLDNWHSDKGLHICKLNHFSPRIKFVQRSYYLLYVYFFTFGYFKTLWRSNYPSDWRPNLEQFVLQCLNFSEIDWSSGKPQQSSK